MVVGIFYGIRADNFQYTHPRAGILRKYHEEGEHMAKFLNRTPSEREGIDRAPRGAVPDVQSQSLRAHSVFGSDILPICPTLTLDIVFWLGFKSRCLHQHF